MSIMQQKYTLKQIADIIGVKDLKLTHDASGSIYTAKNRAGCGPRIFIAWDRAHLMREYHIGEKTPNEWEEEI